MSTILNISWTDIFIFLFFIFTSWSFITSLWTYFWSLLLTLRKSFSNQYWEYQASLAKYFYRLSFNSEFRPCICFRSFGSWIAPIFVQTSVDENCIVYSISPYICVQYMMFWYTSSDNNHSWFLSFHRHLAYLLMILNYINVEIIFKWVSKQTVSNSSISKSRTKNWDIVLIAPIVNTFFIVDFFSKSMNKLAGSPSDIFFFLLFCHLSKNGKKKALKFYVVIIGNQKISYPTVTIESVFNIIHIEFSKVKSTHAFHHVLFDTSSCGNNAVNHFMLS